MKNILLSLLVMTLVGCSRNEIIIPLDLLPDIPVSQLLAQPDTINVDGNQLYLTTEMWRDFMPICPPDGNPLVAIAHITSTDSSYVPRTITADGIWITYNNQVWKTLFEPDSLPLDLQRPYRISRTAINGPKWGPNVFVDVIVRVMDSGGHTRLLRAPHQYIGMVYMDSN